MKEELDIALVKDFPNLYKQRNLSPQETCMCWGFECGNGWEPLIRKLSEKLEAMILKVPTEDRQYYSAMQVKEKYGTLRFYMSCCTDEMNKAIEIVEDESRKICETCGAPGIIRNRGSWLYNSCDKHILED